MSDNPVFFFSLIVPCYNVAEYVGECLDSVLHAAQKLNVSTDEGHPLVQIVCVDDGSTDGTGEILDRYAQTCRDITVIRKKNGGVSSSRNAGLELAAGEWVWFVDGDDAIHPESLSFLHDALVRFPSVDSLMFRQYVEQRCVPTVWPELPAADAVQCVGCRDSKSYYHARGMSWSTIYRRRNLSTLRFDSRLCCGEDTLLSVDYYWRTHEWLIAEATLYFYRTTANGLSRIASPKTVQSWLDVELQLAAWLDERHGEWSLGKMREFFDWNASVVWYTHRDMFFRLAPAQAAPFMPKWLELQRRQFALAERARPDRRLMVAILNAVPSVNLCRFMVLGARRIRAIVGSLGRRYGK